MTMQNRNSIESDNGRRPRQSAELGEGLRKSLAAYAAGAGAAGVGVLALAQPAQADIIVNNNPISIGLGASVPFQINGVTQFTFEDSFTGLFIKSGAGRVLGQFGLTNWEVSRLAKGAVVGPVLAPGESFLGLGLMEVYFEGFVGKWVTTSTGSRGAGGYIGFEMLSGGQTHFGWAHAHVYVSQGAFTAITANVSEFAYDTVANQPIQAGQTSAATPEPATLALLALGSLGLGFWRRRKAAGSRQ